MAYTLKNADSYDPFLTDGVTVQTSIAVECSEGQSGVYNYFKPDNYNDSTNYDLILTAGKVIPRIIPKGSRIYSGSKGSTTALVAGQITLTYTSAI